jgi:hypothetical protein
MQLQDIVDTFRKSDHNYPKRRTDLEDSFNEEHTTKLHWFEIWQFNWAAFVIKIDCDESDYQDTMKIIEWVQEDERQEQTASFIIKRS